MEPLIEEIIAARCEERASAEESVLRVILSAPTECVRIAHDLGVTTDLFQVRDDYRLMFRACEVTAGYPALTTLKLIRLMLMEETFYWRSDAPADDARSYVWSWSKLIEFSIGWAAGWIPLTRFEMVRVVKPLIRLHVLLRDAGEYYRRSLAILEGDAA